MARLDEVNSRDISELARSRNLRTRELWPFNAYYGHADVLRAYAGIPGREPLKTAIEHGIIPFVRSDPDLATWLPRYFCASPAQACFFEEHALHGARPVATGPLILYATALAPPPPATKRRLVYFDAHSTRYVSASYDVDSAIARLTALRDGFDEVVVCLYWRDVQRGRAELYLRRGFRCVTAGHIFDPRFLFRLAEIIASASVVLTDNLGSHLLYALALERPVWFDFSRAAYEVARNAPHRVLPPQEGAMIDRVRTLFGRRVDEIEPEQRAFAAEFAGLDSVRSPAELAALIAEAEAAYRSETPFRRRLQLQARSSARRLWNSRPW